MNPVWLISAAVILVPAIPLAAYGLYQRRERKRERALARRRKEKIDLLRPRSD